jgi:ankyrin repeat protein
MNTRTAVCLLLILLTIERVRAADNVNATFQRALIEEEANRNLTNAIAAYEEVVRHLDDQRRLAATAVFRLGECYRKLGQTNQAAAAYQRIVREFPDESTLVKLSSQNLVALGADRVTSPSTATEQISGNPTVLPDGPRAVQRKLLVEELALVDELIATEKRKWSMGVASNEDVIRLQRDALSLKRQLAALEEPRLLDLTLPTDVDAPAEDRATASGAPSLSSHPAGAEIPDVERQELQRIQALIRDSPDLINRRDQNGYTPLHQAALRGQAAVTEFLIKNLADLNARSASGDTPLHLAAQSGHRRVVELLLRGWTRLADPATLEALPSEAVEALKRSGADVDARDALARNASYSRNASDLASTPLHLAVRNGYRSVVEVLLAHGAGVNATNGLGMTPLHVASAEGHRSLMTLLIDQGAEIDARDATGRTPLAWATERQQEAAAVWLIQQTASVTLADEAGVTPLHLAADKDLPGVVLRLLKQGAVLDAQDHRFQRTPLHWAVSSKAGEALRVLLDHQPQLDLKDHQGFTPLLNAVNSSFAIATELLAKAGADVNAVQVDEHGRRTPALMWTLNEPSSRLLKALLSHGANPNIYDGTQRTALHYAVQGKQGTQQAELLLAHGADPNLPDGDGRTPLHHATSKGGAGEPFVVLLLRHGADPNVQDAHGRTPLASLRKSSGAPGLFIAPVPVTGIPARIPVAGEIVTSMEGLRLSPSTSATSAAANTNAARILGERYQYPELAALLLEKGARERLPDPRAIAVARESVNYHERQLQQGGDDWNRFTLYELVAVQYGLLVQSGTTPRSPGVGRVRHVTFPDLAKVQILRERADGQPEVIPVDIATPLMMEGCAGDRWLEWGDVVEIPEADHPLNAPWTLPDVLLTKLKECLERRVEIQIKGESTMIQLTLPYRRAHEAAAAKSAWTWDDQIRGWDLRTVLTRSGLLRASSDLSQVRVRRVDVKTGQIGERSYDLRAASTEPGLWLREGDIIEVP